MMPQLGGTRILDPALIDKKVVHPDNMAAHALLIPRQPEYAALCLATVEQPVRLFRCCQFGESRVEGFEVGIAQ